MAFVSKLIHRKPNPSFDTSCQFTSLKEEVCKLNPFGRFSVGVGKLSIKYDVNPLRTVSPFVTAHTFCSSKVWSEIFGFLKKFAY